MRKLILLSLIVWLIQGCTPVYHPNVVHTPLMSEAGEFSGAIHASLHGGNFHAAYSPVEHLGVMVNGQMANYNGDLTTDRLHHRFLEGGAGYYLGESFLKVGAYGGFGAGYSMAEDEYWSNSGVKYARGNYWRIFMQPSVGLGTDVVDLSFAPRFAYVHYYRFTSSSGNLNDHFSSVFFEPAVTFSVGYRYAKLITQAGFSVPFAYNDPFDFQPFMWSIGIRFNIKPSWGKGE